MPSVKFTFSAPYRGGSKTPSCKFHFNGGFPADYSHAVTLYHAIRDKLKLGIREDINITGGIFYPNDTSPAAYTITGDTTGGSITLASGDPQALLVAALIRWTTDAHNTRGGPIYLRNFVHGVVAPSTDFDFVTSAQETALAAFAAQFADGGAGFSDGTNTYKRCGPNGVAGLVGTCRQASSRRVLARRG